MSGHCSRSTYGAVPACLHLAVLHEGGGVVRPVRHPAFHLLACRYPYHLPASHCPGCRLSCRLPLKSFACHLLAVRLHDVRILRPGLQHHETNALQNRRKVFGYSDCRCQGIAARRMPACTCTWRSIAKAIYTAHRLYASEETSLLTATRYDAVTEVLERSGNGLYLAVLIHALLDAKGSLTSIYPQASPRAW